MSNSCLQVLNTVVPSQMFSSYQDREKSDPMLEKEYSFLPKESYVSFLTENWNNVDKLNEKFNELRRKEIEENITGLEKYLLYDVIEKRILEFPNPYLPKDYESGMKLVEKYLQIERKFDRKYKRNRISRFLNTISSWLS